MNPNLFRTPGTGETSLSVAELVIPGIGEAGRPQGTHIDMSGEVANPESVGFDSEARDGRTTNSIPGSFTGGGKDFVVVRSRSDAGTPNQIDDYVVAEVEPSRRNVGHKQIVRDASGLRMWRIEAGRPVSLTDNADQPLVKIGIVEGGGVALMNQGDSTLTVTTPDLSGTEPSVPAAASMPTAEADNATTPAEAETTGPVITDQAVEPETIGVVETDAATGELDSTLSAAAGEVAVKETVALPAAVTEAVAAPETPAQAEQSMEFTETLQAKRAMAQLREYWGLPEGITPQEVVRQLDTTLERLQKLQIDVRADNNLATQLSDIKTKFALSLQDGLVHFNGDTIGNASSAIQGALVRINALKNESLIPLRVKEQLFTIAANMARIQNEIDGSVPAYSEDVAMDSNAVNAALTFMREEPREKLVQIAARLAHEIDEHRIDLLGYEEAMQGRNAEQHEQFRDEGMREVAAELRSGRITDEMAAIRISSYLDATIAAAPDTFPSRVRDSLDNVEKVRKGRAKKGQKGTSREITVEMVIDMLRDNFDINGDIAGSNSDPITIDDEGVVTAGEHRAAALMLLYGPTRWMQQAEKLGHKIARTA